MTPIKKNKTGRLFGAHMSISGGIEKAPIRGSEVGCQAMQVFTKSSNNWAAKELSKKDITNFKANVEKYNIQKVVAHDSYLINLASPKDDLYQKSKDTFLLELERAEILGIPVLVFHPGNHMGKGIDAGIERIAHALKELIQKTEDFKVKLALETTAGQGSSIGHQFEQIKDIMDLVGSPERMCVCVDTCHIFAAGYDIKSSQGYEETVQKMDQTFGIDRVLVFHINDSKKDLGSRVDRHEHIGKGFLGLEPFRHLINDKRFIGAPMILETPKGPDMQEDRDNLAILKKLIA